MCPSRGLFIFEVEEPLGSVSRMPSTIFRMTVPAMGGCNGLDFDPRVDAKANASCDAE